MSRATSSPLLALLLAACTQSVNVGADLELPSMQQCLEAAPPSPCPAQPWGPAVQASSAGELEQRLVGAWRFCGGQRWATGRGALGTFYGGAGVELYREADGLRYAFLTRPGPGMGHRAEPWAFGAVRVRLDGSAATAVLVASDGVETPWALSLGSAAPVLTARGFDEWHFVGAP